jgi:hypothetical protein
MADILRLAHLKGPAVGAEDLRISTGRSLWTRDGLPLLMQIW